MEAKACRICGVQKALTDFHRAAGARDGHRSECKECNRAAKRERYAADPQKYIGMVQRWRKANIDQHNAYQRRRRADPAVKRQQRDMYYRRTYGITADEADAMLEAQGGGCAICGHRPERLASLHLDHDHTTGAIRGFLCIDCNHGIGKLRDDPELLRTAADYVERQRAR